MILHNRLTFPLKERLKVRILQNRLTFTPKQGRKEGNSANAAAVEKFSSRLIAVAAASSVMLLIELALVGIHEVVDLG